MKQKKTFQELTIKNDFMFGTSMLMDPESCAGVIERATGIAVKSVELCREKSIMYHPEYKGIRLDVYGKDENQTHYNIEMQTVTKPKLGKRTRYYHSQMDMELLSAGQDYARLPNTYVIFICDFDPFGKEKYRYTFKNVCKEDKSIELSDGNYTIFLSTYGKNETEEPEDLVRFLEFVKADFAESQKDFGDEFIKRLQNTIAKIKKSREMEERYMIFEQRLKDERREAENRLNALNRFLIQDNRIEDLKRAIEDDEFRERLFEEYGIE